jgi:hypothetical protein
MISEALKTAHDATADDGWRYLQFGRIALVQNSLKEAEDDFTKSIDAPKASVSTRAWAYYGRFLARTRNHHPDGGDRKHFKELAPADLDLVASQFQRPGTCR